MDEIQGREEIQRYRLERHNQAVATAEADVVSAYEKLGEAEIKAARVQADATSSIQERFDAEKKVDDQLNSVSQWMQLLRNRLEYRAGMIEDFELNESEE